MQSYLSVVPRLLLPETFGISSYRRKFTFYTPVIQHTKSQNDRASVAFWHLANKINRRFNPFPDGQNYKCLNFEAAKIRARPSAVFAPVLKPPRSRHRPFFFWVSSFFFWAFEAGITGRKHPPFYVNWTALFERKVFLIFAILETIPFHHCKGG